MSILPESTQKIVVEARESHVVHPGLEITKFVPWEAGQAEPRKAEALERVLSAVAKAADVARSWKERRAGWLDALGERALRLEVETLSPCVLWLAAPTALELGFCLHHTYGVPYLPGSGLKGLCLRQSLRAYGGSLEQPDPRTLALFGASDGNGHVGRIDFLDGIPLEAACLELDVMAPHHSKYYQGREKTPHDCEDPVLLTFLRIKVGAVFELALVRGRNGTKEDLEAARTLILEALREFGLGAKTSSGYGRFEASVRGRRRAVGDKAETPPQAARTSEAAKVSFTGVVLRFDERIVVFQAEDGKEHSLDRKELETEFGFKSRGWNILRKERRRFHLEISGGKVDRAEEVKQ